MTPYKFQENGGGADVGSPWIQGIIAGTKKTYSEPTKTSK